MDFDFPTEGDSRRKEVRAWLEKHPKPSARELLDAGYEVPHWPAPYGISADPETQLIISQELQRAGVKRYGNLLSATNLGPTILQHATPAVRERYLEKMLMGEEHWSQLQSEPMAGSDLASVRTTALREGDHYIVNGQKVWNNASRADFACLLARTDPHAAKHAGLSVLIIDMKAPGVTTSPIHTMNQYTTDYPSAFDAVFFDNVKVPIDHLLGAEGDGWRLTQQTLQSERMMILEALPKPTARDLISGLNAMDRLTDPAVRDEAAKLYVEGEMIRLLNLRSLSDQLNARRPGPEAASIKMMQAPHEQRLQDLAKRSQGQDGLVAGSDPFPRSPVTFGGYGWDACFWDSPTLTLRAGSQELMRNIVGERVLGLPRELDPSAKGDYAENLKALGRAS